MRRTSTGAKGHIAVKAKAHLSGGEAYKSRREGHLQAKRGKQQVK